MVEDERLCHLHDCAVDGSHLLCDSTNFVFGYSAFAEHTESDIQIRELLRVGPCFAIVGRDVGRLVCRVSIDPVTSQNALPSLLLALLGLEAFVLNHIGSHAVKMSPKLKISRAVQSPQASHIDTLPPVAGRSPRPLHRR